MNEFYLSQFRISRETALRRRLVSAYDLHKLLWKCFPGRPEARRDFLFRCDHHETELKFLMLSATRPEPGEWAEWDGIKSFRPEFPAGTLYWFRLRANPVIRQGSDGKLRALTTADELSDWLVRKGGHHGFALRSGPEFSDCRLEQFTRRTGTPAVSINVVDIDGVLSVTDSMAFRNAFCQGIGRSRAFGCGLLLLKRITM